ncbi:MAG: helix-turn-helix transcriptional regulator [Bacteroidales bacterium]|nr:helix-turn-helix transcriptional regulator [Bacteroidales bacterium]
MKLHISSIMKPSEWLFSVSKQLGLPYQGEGFINIPDSLGEGYCKQFSFDNGLTLACIHVKLKQEIVFERKEMQGSDLIPVMFYSWNNTGPFQSLEGKKIPIGNRTPNGVFMPSPQIDTYWTIPAGDWYFFTYLVFERTWLKNNLVNTNNSYSYNLISSEHSFCVFEPLSASMHSVINRIQEEVSGNSSYFLFHLHRMALELLIQFFEKIDNRTTQRVKYPLLTQDVQRVFSVRQRIIDQAPKTIPLNTLAHDSCMSVSKLQKAFNAVFGVSISQFALSEKMKLAHNLLILKNHRVSDVALKLGYNSTSHFTEKFKRHFGMNPKEFQIKSSQTEIRN